jgi:hypothetical protein
VALPPIKCCQDQLPVRTRRRRERGTLPRELTCSRCGSSRYVGVEAGARIRNTVAVMERILGDARPIDTVGGG